VAAGFGSKNLLNKGREAAIRWRSEEWLLSASQKWTPIFGKFDELIKG
jgi:hypothetical protein